MNDAPLIAIVDDVVMVCKATKVVLNCGRGDAGHGRLAASPQAYRIRSSNADNLHHSFP
jgi:hypothetical protein